MSIKSLYIETGKRIKRFREAKKMTQVELASHIGLSRTSLANLESGRQQILLHHLFEISVALRLKSPSDLIVPYQKNRGSETSTSLPLPDEGLTKEQKLQVLLALED